MVRYLWMSFILFLLAACDDQRIYEEFVTLPEYWHQEDAQVFKFDIENDSLTYDLIAQFKQDIDYPNYNFYFMYTLRDGRDTVLRERLEEVIFFEPKSGKPLGSGVGDTFDHEYLLEQGITFPEVGEYTVSLRQFMRVDSIPNILRVGVRVDIAVN